MVFWGHTSAQRAKKNMKKRLYIADTHTNEHPHACYNVRPNAGRLNLHNTAHVHAQSYFQTHARRCLYMHNKPMTFSRGIVERLGPLACAISHHSQAARALPSVARAAGYHTCALHRPPLPQTTSSKFGVHPRIWRDFRNTTSKSACRLDWCTVRLLHQSLPLPYSPVAYCLCALPEASRGAPPSQWQVIKCMPAL